MPLTLIYGEAGTGKSQFCINTMHYLFQKKNPVMMIVPEQFAHSAESALLQKNGFLSEEIQATSFKRLAQKKLRQGERLKNPLSKIGKSMLLSRAVMQTADSLSLYGHSALKPGFIDAMLNFIAECKRSEISPQQLASVDLSQNAYTSAKLLDLAAIYEAYQASLDENYIDSEEALTRLADLIKSAGIISGYSVFIDEFFRFTPAELACILSLLIAGNDVYISIGAAGPYAKGVFAPAVATAQMLSSMAKDAGVTVYEPVYLTEKYRFKNAPELLHFESAHHHYSPASFQGNSENVSLYIAPDPYAEIQVLATNICRLMHEKGYHYRDVAIIAGNPDSYTDLIKTVFSLYDIPVFIDQKRSLLSHPIVIMLFSLFNLMSGGIETETLLAYCKTGYSGLTREETDLLENFALAGRLRKQDWLDDTRFLQRADSVFYETESFEETDVEYAQKILDIRNRLLAPLLTLRENLAQSRLVRHRATCVFDFFEQINLPKTVEKEIELFTQMGEQQLAQEHGEIYNLLMTLLDELVTCLGDEKIGMKRLTDILSAGLSQCEISTIPPGQDYVFFGDISRSLVKNVKAVFVIGVNEGSFPAAAPQEGILKDDERVLLAEKGIELGPDGKKIIFHNQYLMYNALCIATEQMHFSYPVADIEGKGLRPASLVLRLRKIFPNLSLSDNLIEPLAPHQTIAGKASAWQYMLEHFNEENDTVATLKSLFKQDAHYRERYKAIERSSGYTNLVENLSPAVATALYGNSLYGSVSQLERYTACPFSYFIHYGLKAKERKILKIDAPDMGSLLHTLIELASKRITKEGKTFGTLDEETITRLADETVTELLGNLFITKLYSENRLAALIRRLKTLVAKMLQVISRHVARGLFEPCAFEVAFSEKGELPPITIDLPTGEHITLIGRIDRIDTLKENADVYIRIIDYKTGNKTFRLSDIYNGLSLQLAVYLTVAVEGGQNLIGGTPYPAGMFYFRLSDKTMDASALRSESDLLKQFKMKGLLLRDIDMVRAMDTGISGTSVIVPASIKRDGTLSEAHSHYATLEQFKKLSDHVRQVAGDIGREILQGGTAISPCKNGQDLPCQYCRFHTICGFDAEKDDYRIAYPFKDDVVWSMLEKKNKN